MNGRASLQRTIDGKVVRFARLDRIVEPDTGMTRGDVVAYYEAVAAVFLSQLRDRPVTRIVFPDGLGGERFFERNAPRGVPNWMRHFTIDASPGSPTSKKHVDYPLIDDLAGLLWMVNRGVLEFHTPQWTLGPRGGVQQADRLVIDLDPGEGAGLDACARVAHIAAARLQDQGLATTIPVTSGGKGLHLYAPLARRRSAMAIHASVQRLAKELEVAHPDLIVSGVRKEGRHGKVFLDWSQNHPARSTATPYTLRGKNGITVTSPRFWDEIEAGLAQLEPDGVIRRLHEHGDIFARAGQQ